MANYNKITTKKTKFKILINQFYVPLSDYSTIYTSTKTATLESNAVINVR